MTPGVDYERAVDEYPELSAEYAHAFRRFVATANYISKDRPDIAVVVPYICRIMRNPTERDWNHRIILGKFLSVRRRFVQLFVCWSMQNPTVQHVNSPGNPHQEDV